MLPIVKITRSDTFVFYIEKEMCTHKKSKPLQQHKLN